MSDWPNVKLKDCCISIADGDHQPPPKADAGVPFVTISNIDAFNTLNFENAMHVPREYYAGLDPKRRATAGDVLYSVVGSFGIPVLIKDEAPFVFQRHIAILRPDKTMLDSRFLYYTMRGKDFYHRADAAAIGAAQRTISLSALKNLEIPCPPLPVQRRIADILSTYDDLIENNRKQIKLLEEAAQRLYKEWFIDLRFPGHEHTPIINGLPTGWEKSGISSFFETVLGGTPSRENKSFWGGIIPWINSGAVNKTRIYEASEFITDEGLRKSATKLMPKHTTVLAITGATLGQVSYTEMEVCANQSVVGIIPCTEEISEYLFMYISSHIGVIISKATGGAQQHINKDIVNAYPFLLPAPDVVSKFHDIINPIFSTTAVKFLENKYLVQARDILLPKLMSGEMEV